MTDTEHIHTEHIHYRLANGHGERHVVAVWADPPWPACPHCDETNIPTGTPYTVSDPANSDEAAVAVGSDMQCGSCGTYIPAPYAVTGLDPTPDEINAAQNEVARQWQTGRDATVQRIRASLASELHTALDRLDAGEEPDDVTSGSEGIPGVWLSDEGWQAWGELDGDIIIVTAADLVRPRT